MSEADAIPHDATTGAPPPPATAADVALHDLDEALADDADQLLDGEFESVDDILDGVFESAAAIVDAIPAEHLPDPPEPAAAARGAAFAPPGPVAAGPDDDVDELDGDFLDPEAVHDEFAAADAEPTAPTAEPEASSTPDRNDLPDELQSLPDDEEPAETLSADPDTSVPPRDAPPAPPAAEAAHPDPDHAAAASEEPAAAPPEMDAGDAPAEEDAVVAPAPEAVDDAESAPEPAPAPEPSDPVDSLDELPVAGRGPDLLKAPLIAMNYPLRLLPDGLREVADWVALTLVFWVPIVWVLVLFVL